jgi:hypothetical protein
MVTEFPSPSEIRMVGVALTAVRVNAAAIKAAQDVLILNFMVIIKFRTKLTALSLNLFSENQHSGQ